MVDRPLQGNVAIVQPDVRGLGPAVDRTGDAAVTGLVSDASEGMLMEQLEYSLQFR
jgi:hypothetical protein